jgi:hypothetical protein
MSPDPPEGPTSWETRALLAESFSAMWAPRRSVQPSPFGPGMPVLSGKYVEGR